MEKELAFQEKAGTSCGAQLFPVLLLVRGLFTVVPQARFLRLQCEQNHTYLPGFAVGGGGGGVVT